MNISQSIKKIHPTLEFDKDFVVFDNSDGKGQQLKWFNKDIKKPTKAQLEKAWVEVEKEIVEQEAKQEKKKQINELATDSDQKNLLRLAIVDIYEQAGLTIPDKFKTINDAINNILE